MLPHLMTSFHNVTVIVIDMYGVTNKDRGQDSSISLGSNVKIAETSRFSLNLFSKGVLVPRSLVWCRENVGVLELFHHGGRLHNKSAAPPCHVTRNWSRDQNNYLLCHLVWKYREKWWKKLKQRSKMVKPVFRFSWLKIERIEISVAGIWCRHDY